MVEKVPWFKRRVRNEKLHKAHYSSLTIRMMQSRTDRHKEIKITLKF